MPKSHLSGASLNSDQTPGNSNYATIHVNVLRTRQSIDASHTTSTNRTKYNPNPGHPASQPPPTPVPESRPYAGNYQGLGAGAAATTCIGACAPSGCMGGGADQKNPPAGAAAKSAATARSSMRGQSKTHVVPSGEAMAGDRRGRRGMAGGG